MSLDLCGLDSSFQALKNPPRVAGDENLSRERWTSNTGPEIPRSVRLDCCCCCLMGALVPHSLVSHEVLEQI